MIQNLYITNLIDNNDYIFAFNNGYLYDCKIKTIREITKQDYISFTCNYPYTKEITKQEKNKVMEFLTTIIPDKEDLHYLL